MQIASGKTLMKFSSYGFLPGTLGENDLAYQLPINNACQCPLSESFLLFCLQNVEIFYQSWRAHTWKSSIVNLILPESSK